MLPWLIFEVLPDWLYRRLLHALGNTEENIIELFNDEYSLDNPHP